MRARYSARLFFLFWRFVGVRYIGWAQSNPESQKDEFGRIGTLQFFGAAELRPLEFRRVCRWIVSRGLQDPRDREAPIFKDRRRRLRYLLRWAARNGISINTGEELLRIAAQEADAAAARQLRE